MKQGKPLDTNSLGTKKRKKERNHPRGRVDGGEKSY